MTPSESPVRIVLVSGSTRAGSTNTAALRTAAALDVAGVVATPWERLVDVPAFVPGDDGPPPPAVAELRTLLAAANAVVFCTPEYAGTLPGSLKNAIWVFGSRGRSGRCFPGGRSRRPALTLNAIDAARLSLIRSVGLAA
jgi:chromate reductase, NAD(P)H dehydrogenase (quinone)